MSSIFYGKQTSKTLCVTETLQAEVFGVYSGCCKYTQSKKHDPCNSKYVSISLKYLLLFSPATVLPLLFTLLHVCCLIDG